MRSPSYLLILGGEHVVVEDGGLLVEPVDVVPHGLTHLGGLPLPLLLIQHPYTHRDRQADRETDRETDGQADRQTDRQTLLIWSFPHYHFVLIGCTGCHSPLVPNIKQIQ